MSDLLAFLQQHEEAFQRQAPNSTSHARPAIPDQIHSSPRLASLYSDFSHRRTTNPDGYAANTSTWLKALQNASRHGLLPNVTAGTQHSALSICHGDQLLNALQSPKWGQPLSLGAVIQDGFADGSLVPVGDFLSAKSSLYAKSWMSNPYRVLTWSLRRLGLNSDQNASTLAYGNFVSVPNLEAATKAVKAHIAKRDSSYTARVMSRQTFEAEVSKALAACPDFADDTSLTSSDAIILLAFLSRDQPILSHNDKVVKLCAPDSSVPEPITQQDTTIANLRDLISNLQSQCDMLTTNITELNTKIKHSLSTHQEISAKSALRSRKLAEQTLLLRTTTLHKLESVFTSIETAASQVELVKIMDASATVLKDLNKESGGVEGVEKVVERLNVQMGNVADVESLLNETPEQVNSVTIEEDELDRELEGLVEQKPGSELQGKPVEGGSEISAKVQMDDEEEKELERRLAELTLPPSDVKQKETI